MNRFRVFILCSGLIGIWSLFLLRGVYLQLLPYPQLEALKKKQFQKIVQLAPQRGDIFDRHGRELAISVPRQSLYADPKLIENPFGIGKKIAKELKIPSRPLIEKLKKYKKKGRRFMWIHRLLPDHHTEAIRSWGYRGLGFKEEYKREYPNGRRAQYILGRVGGEGQGLSGIEYTMDSVLNGKKERIRLQKDARGRALIKDGFVFTENPGGADVQLTIDSDLQQYVEKLLETAIQKRKAAGAWAVILDASTSEVLTLASSDGEPRDGESSSRGRNRAVANVYEVGSVMKAFTVASALQNQIVEPNTEINTENGQFRIGNRVIKEADKKHSFPSLMVSEILSYSSNIGVSKLALELGDEKLLTTFKDFGFMAPSGVELPSEGRGLVSQLPWSDHLLSNISFGQGMAVNAMQVANAYAAVARGGVFFPATLIKKKQQDRSELSSSRRVMDEEKAKQLKLMLTGVTNRGGTGFNARIQGFPVAGKTGTAQRIDPEKGGYQSGRYLSSFAGFFPVNKPKFVVYVAVDDPVGPGGRSATAVAVPLFKKMAEYLLRKSRTEPSYIASNAVTLSQGVTADHLREPALARALNSSSEPSLSSRGATQITYAELQESRPLKTVPSLKGMTLREVVDQFQGHNVDFQVKGKGRYVKSVVPTQGRKFYEGQTIKLRF